MRVALALLVAAAVAHAANVPAQGGKRAPVKPAAKAGAKPAVGVRQSDEEYISPEILSEVFTSTPPSSERGADGEQPLSPEFICSVFGGPSCPDSAPPQDMPCLCDSGEACQCVPYYQCDKSTGSYNEFGVGVIDIRQGNTSCPHYLYKCCKPSAGGGQPPPGSEAPRQPPPTPEPSLPEPLSPPAYVPEDPSPPEPPVTEYVPPYRPPTDEEPSQPYRPPTDEGPSQPPYRPPTEEGPSQPPYRPPTDEGPSQPPYRPPTDEAPIQQPPQPPMNGPPRCGVRNPEGIGVRITGDEDGEAQFGEFPWMVAILKVETDDDEKKRNLYQCGGALITPQVVITAAHCVKTSPARTLKVRAGEWDTQTAKEMYRHQDVTVEAVVVHPEYYAGAVHNDIALLFLNDPVHLGYHIGTICMAEQNQNFDYNKCFVSGWGKDKFGQHGRYQVILKKLELPVVPNDECQAQLRTTRLGAHFILHHSFMCAGGVAGKDTCKGDGGSPLVCPMPHDPTRYLLAGTVAWGIDCGLPGIPGVYGNVPLFRDWVDEQVRQHNIDNTPYLP